MAAPTVKAPPLPQVCNATGADRTLPRDIQSSKLKQIAGADGNPQVSRAELEEFLDGVAKGRRKINPKTAVTDAVCGYAERGMDAQGLFDLFSPDARTVLYAMNASHSETVTTRAIDPTNSEPVIWGAVAFGSGAILFGGLLVFDSFAQTGIIFRSPDIPQNKTSAHLGQAAWALGGAGVMSFGSAYVLAGLGGSKPLVSGLITALPLSFAAMMMVGGAANLYPLGRSDGESSRFYHGRTAQGGLLTALGAAGLVGFLYAFYILPGDDAIALLPSISPAGASLALSTSF